MCVPQIQRQPEAEAKPSQTQMCSHCGRTEGGKSGEGEGRRQIRIGRGKEANRERKKANRDREREREGWKSGEGEGRRRLCLGAGRGRLEMAKRHKPSLYFQKPKTTPFLKAHAFRALCAPFALLKPCSAFFAPLRLTHQGWLSCSTASRFLSLKARPRRVFLKHWKKLSCIE